MLDGERIELGFLGFVGFGKKTQVNGNTGLLGFDADFRVHTLRRAARTSWMGTDHSGFSLPRRKWVALRTAFVFIEI